jgi:hypothetical protein
MGGGPTDDTAGAQLARVLQGARAPRIFRLNSLCLKKG